MIYDVIYADPPWRYRHCKTDSRRIENQYATMEETDIHKLSPPCADNSVLFMWVTAPKVAEAIDLIKAWGFDYRTCAVWDKEIMGMGYWFRGQHELLFVAVKGNFPPPVECWRISSMLRCNRGAHSSKPDHVRAWIEKWYPNARKLEMFSRIKRAGWDSFGNEVEHDLLSAIA